VSDILTLTVFPTSLRPRQAPQQIAHLLPVTTLNRISSSSSIKLCLQYLDLFELSKCQTCPISTLKTPTAVTKRTQSSFSWLTKFNMSGMVQALSRSSSSNPFYCRKSELDQEECNERSLITTEDVASSYENALINQGRLRKSAVELRTLMHQYSILENERGSLPFDAEFHRSQLKPPPKAYGSDAER